MRAMPTDKRPAPGKLIFITGAVVAAALVAASIWSLVRVLGNFDADPGHKPLQENAGISAGAPAAMPTAREQENLEKEYMSEQHMETPPVVPSPAPAAVIPSGRTNDEVILQKAKAKVNQRLVERLKKYAKDNPHLDNRELEKQIKKREQQIVPIP